MRLRIKSKLDTMMLKGHPKEAYFLAWSRFFERAAFYLFKGLIVFFMVGNSIRMSPGQANEFYTWFIESILVAQIIGAMIGDFAIGNKAAYILGGILQSLGCLILCYASANSLFIGLGVLVFGEGLYTPNLLAQFGKHYLDRTRILDAGFTMIYVVSMAGTLLGVICISIIFTDHLIFGFFISGLLFLSSSYLASKVREDSVFRNRMNTRIVLVNKSIPKIVGVIALIGLYWALYGFASAGVFFTENKFRPSFLVKHIDLHSNVSSFLVLFCGILFGIIWSFYFYRRYVKIALGFILASIAYGVLLLAPFNANQYLIFIYFVAMFILAVSEIHLAPILFATITKYTRPKYAATLIGMSFLPLRMLPAFVMGYSLSSSNMAANSTVSIEITAFVMSAIGLLLALSWFVKKIKQV